MGAHANYCAIIYTLINLRDYLSKSKITEEKYHRLIRELSNHEIDPYDEDQKLPTNKELAQTLGFSQVRTNNLLKSLHQELISNSNWYPFEVKDFVHVFYIRLHEERPWITRRRKDRNPILDEYTWV